MRNYLRDELINLMAYNEGEGTNTVRYKLDANECPWDMSDLVRKALVKEIIDGPKFNIYPDSNSYYLRKSIGKYCKVSPDQIIVGSGSDELIQMLVTAFVGQGDTVICPAPSFGMYKIFTLIAGGRPVEVPLDKDFQYNPDDFASAISKHKPKLMFLCSPNNPTGNVIELNQVLKMVKDFDGIVVVDEAYGEFTKKTSLDLIDECPNIIVLRTFSKALGLAGLRIGYSVCQSELASQISKVKPPYNLNSFSQRAAIITLENMDTVNKRISKILEQRDLLYQALKGMPSIKVYPTEGNFLLIRVPDGNSTWEKLMDRGILVRNFSHNPYLENCLRITIGDETANQVFLEAIKEIMHE